MPLINGPIGWGLTGGMVRGRLRGSKMKTDKFRRSTNVEDLRDPNKPVDPNSNLPEPDTISDLINRATSDLAKDAGADDLTKKSS